MSHHRTAGGCMHLCPACLRVKAMRRKKTAGPLTRVTHRMRMMAKMATKIEAMAKMIRVTKGVTSNDRGMLRSDSGMSSLVAIKMCVEPALINDEL